MDAFHVQVYEGVGGDMFDIALNNLAVKGRLIVIGFISGYALYVACVGVHDTACNGVCSKHECRGRQTDSHVNADLAQAKRIPALVHLTYRQNLHTRNGKNYARTRSSQWCRAYQYIPHNYSRVCRAASHILSIGMEAPKSRETCVFSRCAT